MSLLSRLHRLVNRRRRREVPVDADERRQRARLRAVHVIADDADERLALLEARVGIVRRSAR